MNWLQAFILLLGIYLNEASYGHGNTNYYVTPDAQSDVEAPAYIPPYLKHQQFSKTSFSGTKNAYGGGTKNVYSGTKNVYSGTKNVYSDTKNPGYGGGMNPAGHGGGMNQGYGGGGGYSEARQWYSGSSGGEVNLAEFIKNANQKYQQKCDPECKNSGICIDTNRCECPPNYDGKYCEFENKPCVNYPPLPKNSRRKCTTKLCIITCMEGHKFIDGSTVANMQCMDGQWTPSRADLTSISDCQPECDPPCRNGGVCLAHNTCNCPAAYRGPQCDYSESACEMRKLSFNGGYKCFGDESRLKCKLSCPDGAQFSAAPSPVYTCQYATGVFEPQPIPHCVFADVVVITPSNHQNNDSFYSYSENSGIGSNNESFSKTQYSESHSYGGGSHSYGGGSHSYGGGSQSNGDASQSYGGGSHSYGGGSQSYGGGSQSYGGASQSYGGGSDSYGGGNYGGPVQVVIQDMTPKGGTCLTWAGVHYKTFDGMVYTFQSPCQHILLRDPKEHKYSVEIKQSECKRQGYCPSEITVYLEDKSYVLAVGDDGSVLFRNSKRLIPIPASLPGMRVSMPSDHVVVNLDTAGVTIQWDTNNIVQIEGSVLLWNNTEGLCGVLDGNPANDLMTKEGLVVQSKTVLASSWKVKKVGDICEGSPTETAACATETAIDVANAAKFCNDLVTMKKFHKCLKVMDVLQFLEACKWDYCACTKTLNAEECACNAVSVYAKECLRHGVEEMKNWRDADTCPMKCPDGKLFKSCGSDVQPSCAFPGATQTQGCVEGCYCPEGLLLEGGKCVQKKECPCRLRNKSFPPGSVHKDDCNTCSCESGEWICTKIPCGARCRAVGDPHYTTFDGLRYDFMGHCTYTMMQADNVTVHVENVACSGAITEAMNLTPYKGSGKPSCTRAVTLEYGGARIHLKQGGGILVNGKEVATLPVMVGDMRIRAASSLFLIVQLLNKVDLWWDGNTRVFIDVPPSFHGKTKGLCGTFNLNQKDDFLTPENDIEQSTLAFANKWKTREFCTDEAVTEPEHPCKANVESKEAAEKYCSYLTGKIFEACHWHVDVDPYYESCVYDMCACAGDASRCLCPALGDYAMSCAKAGVMLQWRYNVQECELTCQGGQQYTVCADSCLRKCSDTALSSATCEPVCVEGCACPQGQLLDENNMCVPVALCPCFHKGLEFKAGYKEVRAGRRERELCTCVGAGWDCVPASPEQIQNYPPAEDLRTNCSATPNMEFTTCAKTEPLTCKNMHLPPAPLAAECRPGCKCASGYVLDKTSNRCVRRSECPCHHGGTSYPDGHTMQEECNQCECKSGNWSCTTRKCAGLCSAWGDSHVVTFDGTDYDFEGVCTYLLAKGVMDGRDGFDVEIQNVPCGTTGATCSKSVTLKVGSGNDEEIVSLTKHAPLPDISKLKRIKLRLAGAYVFLDVPSLGMSLQWDRGMRVHVKVDSMWHGRVKGLCGNYNGDMRDDFQTPSGGGLAEASPLIFADSWKLKQTCPKPQRIINHCTQHPERKDWAAATCGALKRYPFTLCHTEVPPSQYMERCETDACACDSGGDCECACAALAEYAHACAHRGVTFKWRTPDMCPMQCDEECSNYDACVSACPIETCDNTLYYSEIKTNCEQDTCVEGCKPKKSCPEGQVYKNSTAVECVPVAKCKPVCLTLDDGREVGEGEVIEEDDCHTCRCSKHQRICTGQPCATETPRALEELTSPKPHDEPLQCVGGWTPWISRGAPETASNGDAVEAEPLPQHNELHIGSPMCQPEQMTNIECRTVEGHKTPKETGLNAECSLERGLVCREKTALCPDFEIRTYCQCMSNPCENTTQPNVAHPTDCSKFIECSPQGPVEKQCGDGTLYNPTTLVCDWPAAVAAVRPECGTTESTPLTPTTPTTPSTPPTPKTPTTPTTPSTPSVCPPGQVYSECAYPCDKLCDHFKKTMMSKGKCIQEKCVKGCVDIAVANIKCDYGSYWRDAKTCVPKKDCTCLSDIDNAIVKPGGVIIDGCINCQCRDNELHCDNSECVAINIPHSGSTHAPYILPPITEASTPSTTVSTPSTPSTTVLTPSTPSTTVSTSTTPVTKEPRIPVTRAPIIVTSTVSPPPECAPDNYIDLMWGDEPLPTSAFSASSVVSELFEPQFAQLNGHPLDITAGSWNPEHNDLNQYIQVELPRREPIYGIYLQGSPLFDQYVTSYELMYGDDGIVFHTVQEAGKTKMFRGPTDHNNAMKQMIVPPIEAKFLRLHPLTWHEEIALRMELIGCRSYVSTTPTETTEETGSTALTTENIPSTTLINQCSDLLGVGADLPLNSISVSSNELDKRHLRLDEDSGWRPLFTTPGEWIMFNFTSPRLITGIKMKGGEKGWVTVYKVMFSSDLDHLNPVLDDQGNEKLFPANFDKTSEALTEFRPPINAQYLKVMPVKWHNSIEMRAEPIGCFEPYPTEAPTPTTEGTSTTPPPCLLCPGVPPPDSCTCAPALLYDGEECVPRAQCPCLLSFMSYPVGSTFRGANCDECVCKLGGVTDCKPVKECQCEGPANENLVPKLLPSTCECVCEPCPTGTKACKPGSLCLPLEKWCDGLQDCADDELNCTTPAPVTEPTVVSTHAVTAAATQAPTTTAAPLECPVVSCPVGYKVQYKTARPSSYYSGGDLPPPRPRNSYRRYYGGGQYGGSIKTGFSKGGYSKRGFSKGGFGGLPAKPSQPFTLDKPSLEATPAPSKEVCPQWACVPPVPPFPRPGVTPAPQLCSVVTCPNGYTLQLDTVKGGLSRCPQYECVPPPERPAFCNVTGRTFNTFDGSEYKYDVCFHILARENKVNAWTVVVRKKCRAEGCWNELLISQEDQLILVKPTMMIEYDNYEYTVEQTSKICFQKNSFDIARLGDGVSIKSRKYNFTVLFNKEGDVKIGVLKKHMGTVDGLCGAYDGDAINDRSLPDGNLATSIDQFGKAWGKPGMAADACQARVVAAAKQKRVWDLCSVIAKEPLSRCGKVLNLDKWRSICLEKICECTDLVVNGTKRSEEQCRCLLLQQLVSECLAGDSSVDLAAWRLMMECPAECPAPLVHYDCFRRRCEPSCGVTNAVSPVPSCGVDQGTCHPGCYCPEGTLRRGSDCVLPDECLDCKCNGAGSPAEYVTFEGDNLPFLCNCTYLASRDRNATGQHKYQVFATNALCEDKPATMCTKSVHLVFGKNVIHISRNPENQKLLTTIDDVAVYKLPLKQDWGTVASDNGQDVTITLSDAHVELTVLASKLEFKVSVPSSVYANGTEGLCGVCAGYQELLLTSNGSLTNDFEEELLLTSNGSLTNDFEEYGKSWQANPSELDSLSIPPQEQCDQPPPAEECVPPPPETNPCYNLFNKDRFGACHALVDPESFVHACEADLCANVTDVCGTFERYAAECRAQGVCMDHWRTDLCPYPCEKPLIYRACVDCERTCENYDELAATPNKCGKLPMEGCFCPEGKVRVNNTCIEPAKCFPCDANKEHFAGDQWQTSACTKCTCSKLPGSNEAHVACTTESCTTPVCSSAEDMVKEPPRPGLCCPTYSCGLCCPTYSCVPKPKTAECVEPKKMECGFGQVLKQKTTPEGCTEFACECKPASECESIPSDNEVEMFEPGMDRVIDRSGCCPRAEMICRVDTCPRSPACPQFHDLVVKNDTNKCCPEYSCELPKNKCLVYLNWEAAARGGEKSRTTPQVLFKDLESVWLDGPCRSCRCEPSNSGATSQCSVSECAPILSTDQFVVEPRPVPFACCPLPEQVACRDRDSIYKVGENWTSTDDVCTKYRCVRNDDGQLERVITVQGCDDTCQPGWEYQAPPAGECCGECAPVACVVGGQPRAIGDVWRSPDYCVNYTCTNHNGTLQILSSNETCAEVSKGLHKQFVLKEEKVTGKCCPTVEAVACRDGNEIYQEGQSWQTSDPCKNMSCVRESGQVSTQVHVESCVEGCARGWVYRPPPHGVCCGRCVEDACVVGDELKKPGTTWYSADNCTTFSCARAGDEVYVTSSHPVCADVSKCEPDNLRNETCCQVCAISSDSHSKCVPQSIPSKDTVGLIRKQMGPHGLCKNRLPLRGFQECRGSCESGALYDTLTGVHNTACECCSATKFQPMEVSLDCEDGSTQLHRVASPSKCACKPCGQGATYWGTNTGVKNPHPLKMIMTTPAVPFEKEDENEFIPNIYQRFGET